MIDYTQLPKNISTSTQAGAVAFRRAYARANNAIEGVILSKSDTAFMDNIDPTMPKADFTQAVLAHLRLKG